jgi:hypothetical protein
MRSGREGERRGEDDGDGARDEAEGERQKKKKRKKGGELCNDSGRELGESKAVFDPRAV